MIAARVPRAIVFLNFVTMYMQKAGTGTSGGVVWVKSRHKIAVHYMKGWFAIDTLSMIPSLGDFIAKSQSAGTDGTGSTTWVIFRVVRALKLVKLIRLNRASKLLARWQARVSIDYGTLVVSKCLIKILFACHWFACLFRTQAAFADSPLQTWMGTFGYCGAHLEANATGHVLIEDLVGSEHVCIEPGAMYLVSIYWSIMIITGSGGTDFYAQQFTIAEMGLVSALVLLGALIWTDVLASFCDVATNSDPSQTEYNQDVDDLNRFMDQRNLPQPMKEQLREYFHQIRHLSHSKAAVAVLRKLSPDLRQMTTMFCFGPFFLRVEVLRSIEDACIAKIALNMVPVVSPAEEHIGRDVLYFINKGVVLSEARALGRGDHFNAEILLANPHLRKPLSARAMTYLELYAVSLTMLRAVLDEFPESRLMVRIAVGFLALRRALAKTLSIIRTREKHGLPVSLDDARVAFQSAVSSSEGSNGVTDARVSKYHSDQRRGSVMGAAAVLPAPPPAPPPAPDTLSMPLTSIEDAMHELETRMTEKMASMCKDMTTAILGKLDEPRRPREAFSDLKAGEK
jgi:hypothetical protein